MSSRRPTSRRSPTAGNRGQGGKWIWPATRVRIYERDGWRCVWCRCEVRRGGNACLDHILPRECGGSNKPHNLLTSCLDCNEARGTASALMWAAANRDREPVHEVLERVLNAMATPLPKVKVAA